MNKLFLEHYMHTAPEGTEPKYIFLTDDREIGFNIIASGYKAILILEQEDGYYNVDSFIAYMDEIMLTGAYQSEYCYIPACSEKRINDTLEQYFKQNLMKYHLGWRLFKNKEYLGYCMTTDTRFQKFLMIKGKGGTGKSVVISFAQHLIGMENFASMSLQNLNERFYPTGLFGKLLNACADIPSTAMERVDIIKKAVGEDTLLYEKKGQDPTQFNSYAKLLFSANELPLNLDDKTNAYRKSLSNITKWQYGFDW